MASPRGILPKALIPTELHFHLFHLTEECTGDVDKTYRGDCHHHDSRAQPYHSDSWRICLGSDGSELLTPIITDITGKAHNTVQSPDGGEVAGQVEVVSPDDDGLTRVELQKCDGLCKVREGSALQIRDFCDLVTGCVDEKRNLGDMLGNLFAESRMSKSRNVDHMPYPCAKCEIVDRNLKWCLPTCKTGYSVNCTFDSGCRSSWCNLYHMRPHSNAASKLYASATAVKRACLARQALTDVLARECTLNDMYCMVAEVTRLYPAGVWDHFTVGKYLDDAFKDIAVPQMGMTVDHDLCLDENAIITKHAEQYAAFEEKVCNVPVFACISCHMLRRKEEVVPSPLQITMDLWEIS